MCLMSDGWTDGGKCHWMTDYLLLQQLRRPSMSFSASDDRIRSDVSAAKKSRLPACWQKASMAPARCVADNQPAGRTERCADKYASERHLYKPTCLNQVSSLGCGNLLIGSKSDGTNLQMNCLSSWRENGQKNDFALSNPRGVRSTEKNSRRVLRR